MQLYLIPEEAIASLLDTIKDAPLGCNMTGRQQDAYILKIRSSLTPVPQGFDIKAQIDAFVTTRPGEQVASATLEDQP